MANYLKAMLDAHTGDIGKQVDEFYDSMNDTEKICAECLFIFDHYAPVGSEREAFLIEYLDQFRRTAGREETDKVLKTKYENYFGMMVKAPATDVTPQEIETIGRKIAALELVGAQIVPIFQAGALYKSTGTGKQELLELIRTQAPHMSENDRNMMLYIVIPGLQDQLEEKEKEELLALTTNESIKGHIIHSLR
ncbi:MAG: hypothetical protein LUD68_10505 [Rikenellaceae bacterium]|nr:hypothetical protein [Rikenellaceae bacterium]